MTANGAAGANGSAHTGSAREEAERLVASLLGAASVAIRSAELKQQLRNLSAGVTDGDLGGLADLAAAVLGGSGRGGGGGRGGWGGWGGGGLGGHAGPHARTSKGASTGLLSGLSTGSPECCICPLCKVIAALRDPSPEFAERLASGAGDVAAGVTGVLRAFGELLHQAAGAAGAAGGPESPAGSPDSPAGSPDSPAGSPDSPAGDHAWPEQRVGESAPTPRKPMAKKAVKVAGAKASNGVVPETAEPQPGEHS